MKQFTEKSFANACRQVFEGVTARQDKIHELCLVAVFKGLEPSRDFGWLSLIANMFDSTKGLNTDLFATWVKQSITYINEDGQSVPALVWQKEKQSFKLAAKGIEPVFVSTCKWYESKKVPTMDSVYNPLDSFERAFKVAQKKLKEGALTPEQQHFLNKMMSAFVEAKSELAPAKPAVHMPTGSLTPAQAAEAGVI